MAHFATPGAADHGHHPGHWFIRQGIHHGPRCCCRQKPRPATACGGVQAIGQTAQATSPRPGLLGPAFPPLAKLAFNVTTNPYAEWTAQQIINAFPYEKAPRLLIRARDEIYSPYFTKRVEGMGIEEVPTALRSPWQNPYCERVIGSIR
jgi:hypothetical protein